jgi:uncharacterized protein with NRDE domain
MCLLVVAYDAHPDYQLLLIGHRDEFHARPAAPLDWWPDRPRILAGRDLAAGGTWMGISRQRRLGVVTNIRDRGAVVPGAPSRGLLIPEFLDGDAPAEDFCRSLAGRASGYSGFNLLTFDGETLAYCANRPDPFTTTLPRGIYGLSNWRLDTPWPKVERARERVRAVLAGGRFVPEALFAALLDREPAPDAELPDTGIGAELERLLSAPFIVGPDYGTRCTTLVQVRRDGSVRVEERRYSPAGETTGRTTVGFHTSRAPAAGG